MINSFNEEFAEQNKVGTKDLHRKNINYIIIQMKIRYTMQKNDKGEIKWENIL